MIYLYMYILLLFCSQNDPVDYVSLLENDDVIRHVYQPILQLMDKALNRRKEKSAAELRIQRMRSKEQR